MLKEGSRIKLISVPDCCTEDLNRTGVVKRLFKDLYGTPTADILLDGDDGLTVCFQSQLEVIY